FESKTPGHPEYGEVPGVEITTGPLGQGIANSVGFAMAGKIAQKKLNSATAKIIDHKVYALCGDGDLEEGISYEACALAGHLCLDNLVMFYDCNHITIEGDTSLAWSEDVKMRFEAQGWQVSRIDGHNYEEINEVLLNAKEQTKPYLIIADTIIAKGAIGLEGTSAAHGAPLGVEVIRESKLNAGFNPDKEFYISEDVKARFECAVEKGDLAEREWKKLLNEVPYVEQNEALKVLLNPDFSKIAWPKFEDDSMVATRDSNGQILNAIARAIPGFIGGSADLAPSNKSLLKDMGFFPAGRNIHFGIREHSMAAMTNAMALYGLFIPFSATFFIFSDYLKPAARLSALMKIQNFFVWTHDSIGVGEDGPTHQPIEQLSQFRAMPNFYTFRPADASENVECWKKALSMKNSPSAFVLSRQKLQTLKAGKIEFGEVANGGYLIKKRENATLSIIASGSELMPALKASCHLELAGINANVVSVPCFDLFVEQKRSYINSVIDPNTKVLAVEASSGVEWYRFADDVLCMNSFGASAPAGQLFKKFGFTIKGIKQRAMALMNKDYVQTEAKGEKL
ncbi:MAG: transketolase, partial [Campylobacteraceae bacterium]|nr:transketolase [Campylobacteraceae bacterium]